MTAAAILLLVATFASQPAESYPLHGQVVDPAGLPIANAQVSSAANISITGADGSFSLVASEPEPLLRVRATGFAEFSRRVRARSALRVVLQPAAIADVITVTAGRSLERLADTASATTSLPSAVVLTSAALAPDDLLRTVPGFSLFRRSSSRVANPTTQGASLRGLAASGASRALVLADGVPINDPFGGWVYWNRVPQAAIDRIEVVRGGSGSDLYGHESLAGTVQLFTPRTSQTAARLIAEAGQHGSGRASAYAGSSINNWTGLAAGERLVFDGFPIVAEDERGPIDANAGVRHTSVLIGGGHASGAQALSVRGSWLSEYRNNGTALQWNDTDTWTLSGHVTRSQRRGSWSAGVYGGAGRYRQTFSAVNADRTAEALTAEQHIETNHQGASAQWTGAFARVALLVGADVRRSAGESLDVARGGTQLDSAGYGRFTLQLHDKVTMSAGLRGGTWTTEALAGGDDPDARGYIMPRVSVSWSPTAPVTMHASWSAPGRTPTLNELYRDFRVGNTVTQANDALRPEAASALEAGMLFRARAASARLIGFWTVVDEAITNVTLSAGALIRRQRQNAGRVRARGFELEGEWRARPWMSAVAGVAWFDSTFTEAGDAALVGLRVPQVPMWQGAASLRLTPGRAMATIDVRGIGPQYDDDRNQFLLRRAFVTDIFAGASVRRVQPFVAVENVFDVDVDVGRTPVRTVGTPRSARAGVRLFF